MKILIGVTKGNELYEIEISPKSEQHNYFSMSGHTVSPVTYAEAKREAYDTWIDYFTDDPEAIREMNTRLGTNFRSPISATKHVLSVDGELHGFDNSLMTDEIEHAGRRWLFRSSACGQHQEREFKKLFIPPDKFNQLMHAWDTYHLKPETPELPQIPEQDREYLMKRAIDIIRLNRLGVIIDIGE